MLHLLIQLIKYLLILLFAVYTYSSFAALRSGISEKRRKRIYRRQTRCMILFHLLCYIVIFAVTQELRVWVLYGAGVGLVLLVFLIYRGIYRYVARQITNHMCMLMLLGFSVLTRLNYTYAVRQIEVAALAIAVSALVPLLITKMRILRKFTWLYAAVGIAALGAVLAFGTVHRGANLSFTILGFTFQPSEVVKLIFVFFAACILCEATEFRQIVIATVVAAIHVIILVLSTDLGAALIFFITYIVMLYTATRKLLYLGAGLGAGVLAALAASKLFNHVKTRIAAWKDPFANFTGGGYQVAQALFAIGTGGWLGVGFYEGMPEKIPLYASDFIFAAIAEEFGVIFSILLILVCLGCFLMMTNVAMQINDMFYKLIALGFGCIYGTQVFLNIGGVIKCIPSTGLTLPLISYGGSSIFCTIIMFAVIQGLYIERHNEGEIYGTESGEQESGQRPGRPGDHRTAEYEQTQEAERRYAGTADHRGGQEPEYRTERRSGRRPDRRRERAPETEGREGGGRGSGGRSGHSRDEELW